MNKGEKSMVYFHVEKTDSVSRRSLDHHQRMSFYDEKSFYFRTFWDIVIQDITDTGLCYFTANEKPRLMSSVLHHCLILHLSTLLGRVVWKSGKSGGKSRGQESGSVFLWAGMESWWTKPQIVSRSPRCLHWSFSLGKSRNWDVRV